MDDKYHDHSTKILYSATLQVNKHAIYLFIFVTSRMFSGNKINKWQLYGGDVLVFIEDFILTIVYYFHLIIDILNQKYLFLLSI